MAFVVTDVEQRADVRVGQPRYRSRFMQEPQSRRGRRQRRFVENLDRDQAVQSRIACLVDLPHPSGAKLRQNFVRPQALAWHQYGRDHRSIFIT